MLEIMNLSCFYEKEQVLKDINLTFEKGTFTAVLGLNGSGKSTLLSCISSVKEYKGNIMLDGRNLKKIPCREKAKRISYLPQFVRKVPFTVEELVSFGRNPYGDILTDSAKEKVRNSIDELSLFHIKEKRADKISGGELRLSYFSMLLCQDSDIMLLDEAGSGLDAKREEMLYSCAVKKCKEQGKTVISVIHNLSCAAEFADKIVIVEKGKVRFFGNRDECLEACAIEKNFGVKRYTALSGGCERIFFA